MSFMVPIYTKFDGESLEEALDKINEIFDELFANNRFIVFISFSVYDGIARNIFITHSPNIKQPLRYEMRAFEIPEDACLAQQVLEQEFLSSQNAGWYIKNCKIFSGYCSLLLQRKGDYPRW